MKSEVLLAILKDLVSEIENIEKAPTHGNTDLGLSALIIASDEAQSARSGASTLELFQEEEEVQTLDDLFQELIEYARDEEEYELVSALEGIYSLWYVA